MDKRLEKEVMGGLKVVERCGDCGEEYGMSGECHGEKTKVVSKGKVYKPGEAPWIKR